MHSTTISLYLVNAEFYKVRRGVLDKSSLTGQTLVLQEYNIQYIRHLLLAKAKNILHNMWKFVKHKKFRFYNK